MGVESVHSFSLESISAAHPVVVVEGVNIHGAKEGTFGTHVYPWDTVWGVDAVSIGSLSFQNMGDSVATLNHTVLAVARLMESFTLMKDRGKVRDESLGLVIQS